MLIKDLALIEPAGPDFCAGCMITATRQARWFGLAVEDAEDCGVAFALRASAHSVLLSDLAPAPRAAWLVTTLRRVLLDFGRHSRLLHDREVLFSELGLSEADAGETPVADSGESAEEGALRSEIDEPLAGALRCLPPMQREALMLRYRDGLSLDEVAHRMELS